MCIRDRLRNPVKGHKAGIVAGTVIFGAGIAQPHNNVFHRAGGNWWILLSYPVKEPVQHVFHLCFPLFFRLLGKNHGKIPVFAPRQTQRDSSLPRWFFLFLARKNLALFLWQSLGCPPSPRLCRTGVTAVSLIGKIRQTEEKPAYPHRCAQWPRQRQEPPGSSESCCTFCRPRGWCPEAPAP